MPSIYAAPLFCCHPANHIPPSPPLSRQLYPSIPSPSPSSPSPTPHPFTNHPISNLLTMPIRPFPYPLKIGIDIVRTSRIASLISKPRTTSKPTSTKSNAGESDANSNSSLNAFMRHLLTARERSGFRDRFEKRLLQRESGEGKEVEDDQIVQWLSGRYVVLETIQVNLPVDE